MERITDIKELKPGQQIWHINQMTGNFEIMEFVCIHPHNEAYSVFLNQNYDGMPKFYNKNLENEAYYPYDGSASCWDNIYNAQKDWHNMKIRWIEQRESRRREQTEKAK